MVNRFKVAEPTEPLTRVKSTWAWPREELVDKNACRLMKTARAKRDFS